MKEYIIVAVPSGSGSHSDLANKVNRRLKSGYKPVGGVCLGPDGILIQAMVR